MNMSARNFPVEGRRGVTLIEVLIYAVLFSVFMLVASNAYISSENQARSMRGNAIKIIQVMNAGERWRQDIRDAISPPQNIQSSLPNPDDPLDIIELTSLKIIKSSETNWYAFRGDHVFRMSSHLPTQWELVMDKVNGSTMVEDQRGKVAAWRWEVELKKITKKGQSRPLFTFLAAPQKPQDP
jgi:Tfp pilus assembly protein PilE